MTLSQRIGVVEINTLAFQVPSANKANKSSFFPQTINDWNDLPDSLISSAEMSDDSVSKFASLVRARDCFPSWCTPLVKYCQFSVSPVNHSDSEHIFEKKSQILRIFKNLYFITWISTFTRKNYFCDKNFLATTKGKCVPPRPTKLGFVLKQILGVHVFGHMC